MIVTVKEADENGVPFLEENEELFYTSRDTKIFFEAEEKGFGSVYVTTRYKNRDNYISDSKMMRNNQ